MRGVRVQASRVRRERSKPKARLAFRGYVWLIQAALVLPGEAEVGRRLSETVPWGPLSATWQRLDRLALPEVSTGAEVPGLRAKACFPLPTFSVGREAQGSSSSPNITEKLVAGGTSAIVGRVGKKGTFFRSCLYRK